MAWSDNPKIRDLEPYAQNHDYMYVVLFGVRIGGEVFDVTTYGRTPKLCKAAAVAGDELAHLVKSGGWPRWPAFEPGCLPVEGRERELAELRMQVQKLTDHSLAVAKYGARRVELFSTDDRINDLIAERDRWKAEAKRLAGGVTTEDTEGTETKGAAPS